MNRETIFSPCRKYRYTLWRSWGVGTLPLIQLGDRQPSDSYVQFIGLNPSTADEVKDDPTIRRCIQFAKDWGYGALCMTNAFAFRDTDPKKMKAEPEPVGEFNDHWLKAIAANAGVVVAAWGKDGKHLGRADRIKEMIPKLQCLGQNKDGSPKHPLYLRGDMTPIPFTAGERLVLEGKV